MKGKHVKSFSTLMVALVIAVTAAETYPSASPPPLPIDSAERQARHGCQYECGDVKVPYPFGINEDKCSLNSKFTLNCSTESKLYVGNVRVLHIDTKKGQMDVFFSVSQACNDPVNDNNPSLNTAWLTISNKENINKFVTIGRDSYGYLYDYDGNYSTGCLTRYYGNQISQSNDVDGDGGCTGRGCCHVDIPDHMRNISIEAQSFKNTSDGTCSYSFVAKKDNYTFHPSHITKGLPFTESTVVLDWAIGNQSCNASNKSLVCNNNSRCSDDDIQSGYICLCSPGYEGNPYHPAGCTDIDECATHNHTCYSNENCRNVPGNYTCFCPLGETGNGTMEGGKCQRGENGKPTLDIILGAGAAIIVLFVGTSSYITYQKRKFDKLKRNFFKQNGGFILREKLHERKHSSSQTAHIFKEMELKKATNNFEESSIIGRGGFGTVFKGKLANNTIVAIKKSKTIDTSQIEQFINEVDVVSQINHRNVVKLLGCCLETQVPLLVYEFVSNGTLSDFINKTGCGNANNETWLTRLRIAAEVAGALSYLHSAAVIPIIHRDVKSDNILLDENHTTKVSDFGASRFIPLDKTEVATMVQGTIGYLDPEYMLTGQLTEKSDVYSFGVVLVELLTGEKSFFFGGTEERRSLAMHFLSCMKNDKLLQVIQDEIINEGNIHQIKEVAFIAAKCLSLRGEERPYMKEVAMELEGLRLMDKKSWINKEVNGDETCFLLSEASSSIYETGDSSKYGDSGGYDSLKDQVLIDMDDGR